MPNVDAFQYEAICHREDGCLAVLGSTLGSAEWTGCIQLYADATEAPSLTTASAYSFCERSNADMIWFDKASLLVASDSGEIVLWQILDDSCTSLRRTASFLEHNNVVSSIDVNQNKIAVSGSWDRSVKLWDVAKEASIGTFQRHTSEITCVKWNPSEMNTLVFTSKDGSITICDMRESSINCTLGDNSKLATTAVCHCTNVNSSLVAIGFENGNISLFDIRKASEGQLSTISTHKRWINRLVCYKNGKIISASNDCMVSVFNINNSEWLEVSYQDSSHQDFVKGISCHPEGEYFQSCGWDSQVKIHHDRNIARPSDPD